jgi:hypothetical protein
MTKKQTMTAARRCRAKLKSPLRWKICLWENNGWCWCLHSGPITIWDSGAPGKYYASLAELVPPAGKRYPGSCQWGGGPAPSKDPNKLVRSFLKDVRHHIDTAQQVEKWLAAL